MEIGKWIGVFIFGAAWGSFFYTLALRYINGQFSEEGVRALLTPSSCPYCKNRIHPHMLIPLLGFVIGGGRCSECRERIPIAYTLMEALYGTLCVVLAMKQGINAYSVFIFLICGLSITLALVDIKRMIIPNPLMLAFLLLVIYPTVLNMMNSSVSEHLLGFVLMAAFFLIVLLFFPGSFGGGDIKMAAVIGLLTGFEQSIVVLEAALITGSVIGVVYAFKSGRGLRIKLPFAPFLAIGLIVSLLYGRDIILFYYRIVY